MKLVWVQLGNDGRAIEVYKNQREMFYNCPADCEAEMGHAAAVKQIRDQVWERQNSTCARCPTVITKQQMHLHERKPRGQGGNYSVENSEGLCYPCHLGEFGAHPEKQLRFTKPQEKI